MGSPVVLLMTTYSKAQILLKQTLRSCLFFCHHIAKIPSIYLHLFKDPVYIYAIRTKYIFLSVNKAVILLLRLKTKSPIRFQFTAVYMPGVYKCTRISAFLRFSEGRASNNRFDPRVGIEKNKTKQNKNARTQTSRPGRMPVG